MKTPPSDEQLRDAIEEIIRNGDLGELSTKLVRSALEMKLECDLSDRKQVIKEQIQLVLDKMDTEDSATDLGRASDDTKKRKEPEDSDSSKKTGGLMQPMNLSPALADLCGTQVLPRTQVVKHLSAYVKTNNLQKQSDRRVIVCDEKLKALLGIEEVTYFQLQKYLTPHFLGPNRSGAYVSSDSDSKKKAKRAKTSKSETGGVKRSVFSKPSQLSEALAAVVGVQFLGRPQVVKHLWKYIRAHNLQDPSDRRRILCDSALKEVMGVSKVTMTKMNTYLSKHLVPIEDADTLELAWQTQQRFIAQHEETSSEPSEPPEEETEEQS